jgi:hypothetical protein
MAEGDINGVPIGDPSFWPSYADWQRTQANSARSGPIAVMQNLEIGFEVTSIQDMRRGDIVQANSVEGEAAGHQMVVTSTVTDDNGVVIGSNMINANEGAGNVIKEEYRAANHYQEMYIGRFYDSH